MQGATESCPEAAEQLKSMDVTVVWNRCTMKEPTVRGMCSDALKSLERL